MTERITGSIIGLIPEILLAVAKQIEKDGVNNH